MVIKDDGLEYASMDEGPSTHRLPPRRIVKALPVL